MSELRKDILTGRWVIIAPERAKRPNAFKQYTSVMDNPATCPFCVGHEHMTPPSIVSYPKPQSTGSSGWTVRVISNRFPALRIEGELEKTLDGIYDKIQGIGAHEVIVETAEHAIDMADYSSSQMYAVIESYRDRMSDLLRDSRFHYVLVFKNYGTAAGATLSHSHSQVIALPIVPVQLERELNGAQKYHEFRGRCYFCDSMFQEQNDPKRIVVQNEDFIVYAPYASRFPFELCLLPKQHNPFFWMLSKKQTESLSEILRDVLRRYKLALRHPPYGFMIHTAPPDFRDRDTYHWHMELWPKLTEVGGFEWGSGFYINPETPEDAAKHLRDLEDVMDIPQQYLLPTARVTKNGT